MKKLFLSLLAVLTWCQVSDAANWYVRPGGAGSKTGADWSNAWDASGIKWQSVAVGDTVWLAGGSYAGSLTTGASGNAGSPINISRVLASDTAASSAPGWQASFDSPARFGSINIPGQSYININGRVKSGIVVTVGSSGGSAMTGATSASISNITISYVEFFGPPNKTGLSYGRYGINIAPSSNTVNNLTIDHCWVHQWCEALRSSNWNNVVIQYSTISDTDTDNIDHADVVYNYPHKNVTWRYNSIFNSPVDGIFHEFGGAVNFQFYGNIYWNSSNHLIYFKAPGTYGPIFIYNNVFAAPNSSNYAYITTGGSTIAAGSLIRNNVFLNTTNDFGSISDYNAYIPATVNGYSAPQEPHGIVSATNPFVSSASGDFHLTAAGATLLQNKGAPLTTDGYINKDVDGNTRGSDGTWDIGAYEYAKAGPTPTATPSPSSPTPTPTATPIATPTPIPTITPTPTPSNKFHIGSTVSVGTTVNVRQTPGGTLLGIQPAGKTGTVIGGPIAQLFSGINVNWWDIVFVAAPNGWTGEDNLLLATATPTPTPAPTPTPTATPMPTYNAWVAKLNAQIASGVSPVQLLSWIQANPPASD
jgi:hypothetical protein